jgi:hypothetical protein
MALLARSSSRYILAKEMSHLWPRVCTTHQRSDHPTSVVSICQDGGGGTHFPVEAMTSAVIRTASLAVLAPAPEAAKSRIALCGVFGSDENSTPGGGLGVIWPSTRT